MGPSTGEKKKMIEDVEQKNACLLERLWLCLYHYWNDE
jgi:hypothetical protein